MMIMAYKSYQLRLMGLVCALGVFPCTYAAEYHVAKTGADTNAGAAALPFLTVQRAAGVMVAGDTCIIHTGIYRETLRPAHSGTVGNPITFTVAGDGPVTLSGADPVVGWTLSGGDVYSANVATNLGSYRNQIFVDGQMMVEARTPNLPWNATTGFNFLNPPLLVASCNARSNLMTVPTATQPAGAFDGATMWAGIGARWACQTAQVTSSVPGTLTINKTSWFWFPDYSETFGGNEGGIYLFGLLSLLDAPGEWFLGDGSLRLMTVDRSNPTSHLVEVRSDRHVADLTDRDWIVLDGLYGFAGDVLIPGSNCILQNCTFRYISQESPMLGYAQHTGGISVSGSGNRIQRCLLDTSSSNGILLGGTQNVVTNCRIKNTNYVGDYSGGVTFSSDSVQNTVEYCTITNSGRSCVGPWGIKHTVSHNDLSHSNMLTQDGAAIYVWGTDSQGTVISYNRVHDTPNWTIVPATSVCDGIYLDNGSKNYIIHHNVVWNTDDGIRINRLEGLTTSGHRVYNNTLYDQAVACMGGDGHDPRFDILTWNNLSARNDFQGTDLQHNLATTSPLFVNQANQDFRLQSGSPAVDAGRVIPGYTDGFQGTAPDVGAYESGVVAWTAGAAADVGATSAVVSPPSTTPPPSGVTGGGGSGGTTNFAAEASDENGSCGVGGALGVLLVTLSLWWGRFSPTRRASRVARD